MKKINWCKWLGHRWQPVYIRGRYSNIEVKFIGCVCERCYRGKDDLLDASGKLTERRCCTYSEEYYDK